MDKIGHYIMIKEPIHQEDKIIVNFITIMSSLITLSKMAELQGEIEKFITRMGNFHILCSEKEQRDRR